MKHVGCPVAANLAIAVIPQQAVIPESCRRDGRVAEGARLESVFTRKGNVGSNPTLSASLLYPTAASRVGQLVTFLRKHGIQNSSIRPGYLRKKVLPYSEDDLRRLSRSRNRGRKTSMFVSAGDGHM